MSSDQPKPTMMDLLSQQAQVSASVLERLVRLQRERGGALAELVVKEGVQGQDELFELMFGRVGHEVVADEHLRNPSLSMDIRVRVPREEALALLALPLQFEQPDKRLTVALFDPTDSFVLDRLRTLTGATELRIYLARRQDILRAVRIGYGWDDTLVVHPTHKTCPLCARGYPADERFCPEHALPLQSPLALGDLEPGELSGHVLERRYQLGGVLGSGGMGTVYLAEYLRTGLRCAVKVLRPELSMDLKMRRRLFREIQANSQVRHPNITEILDFGEDPRAGAFMVMEYLTGRSLEDAVKEQTVLELPFCLEVTLQLCAALSAIHSRGLVHCDLKPRNVQLLTSGRLKLLDFGLSKPFSPERAEEFQRITTGFMAYGTPCYMSPEQARAQPLDQRSDIYALGIMIYEMLMGHPPFEGGTYREVLEGHVNKPVPLPDARGRTVMLPPTIEVLLLRMLSKEPEGRPRSVVEVADTMRLAADELKLDLTRVELGVVAAARALVPEPTRQAGLSLPAQETPRDVRALAQLITRRKGQVVERLAESLKQAIPRYRTLDPADLLGAMGAYLEAVLAQLGPNTPGGPLPEQIEREIDSRSAAKFSASELFGAFWIGFRACRPLLVEVAAGDLDRYRDLADFVDRRALRFFLRMSEHYVASTSLNLARRSELLARQNEELMELRAKLDGQLRQTHEELVKAEQVKARVADCITTGLVLVQLSDQRVQLFNRAAERLSGLQGDAVLGRPISDIFHLVEGMPFEEFVEQIRLHGQVGLRKLRVRFPGGTERTIYMRGEPFSDGQGQQTGVLFVVEDVTEREMLIESFSRYVSREVAQLIVQRGKPLRPTGRPRQAVLLVAGVHGFAELLREQPGEQVVQLLDQYIRTVGDAVFVHGGVIDTVTGARVMSYFAGRQQDYLTPVRAAMELGQRLARLNARRLQQGQLELPVGIGLHVGQVLVVNVGGHRRMVHTVLGEPTEVAVALQKAARPGEILLSPELAAGLDDSTPLEHGPRVRIKSRDLVLAPLRLKPGAPTQAETMRDMDPAE